MLLQMPVHRMMLAATALLLSGSEVVSASCHVLDHAGGTIKADGTPCDGSEEDKNADFMMRDNAAARFVVRLAGCRGGRHPLKHGDATTHPPTDDSDSRREAFGCAALC